jgi:hypothetical protein
MNIIVSSALALKITMPLIQGSWWSYLLTTNPIAAVFSHVAMHVAGVLHGPASVMQLPPHYQ